ncbi:MAG: Na+/H+ antiporter subunit C [Chromatiaceae bacterium]|jgi:multicomponent K+:H+ antiporter subunit C
MEALIAAVIGLLVATGIYLLLRPRVLPVVFGLTLLSYGANLLVFSMGRLRLDAPPVLGPEAAIDPAAYADPLPQALVLTAIVIGFAMTAFILVLALRSFADNGTDHVDGEEPPQ